MAKRLTVTGQGVCPVGTPPWSQARCDVRRTRVGGLDAAGGEELHEKVNAGLLPYQRLR
jgi:hypothetical protein